MIEIVAALFRHHAWANLWLIDACAALPDDVLDASTLGTSGSVRETLVHVVSNEDGYLAVWEQTEPPGREAFAFRGFADLRARAERNGRRLAALAERAEGDPEVRGEWRGGPFALPTSVCVTQVVNHATEHRAPIATILSQQGIAPPVLDGWTYDEETNRRSASETDDRRSRLTGGGRWSARRRRGSQSPWRRRRRRLASRW